MNVGSARFDFKAKASNTTSCDGAIPVVPLVIASATLASAAALTKAVVEIKVELLPAD